jgi:hypothetical protein
MRTIRSIAVAAAVISTGCLSLDRGLAAKVESVDQQLLAISAKVDKLMPPNPQAVCGPALASDFSKACAGKKIEECEVRMAVGGLPWIVRVDGPALEVLKKQAAEKKAAAEKK